MKQILILLLISLSFIPSNVEGQSCYSLLNAGGGIKTPTTTWKFFSNYTVGAYSKFYVVKGAEYTWSLCASDGGSIAGYDLDMTLRDLNTASGNAILYADDVCGNAPRITWTATYTGIAYIVIMVDQCLPGVLIDATLAYHQNSFGASPVSNFPLVENWEDSITQWQQISSDDFDWTSNSGSTPSTETGPNNAYEGTSYLYTEATGNFSKTAVIESPNLDMSNITNPELSFWYHLYGVDMGTLSVEATTNGYTWTTLWSLSGNQDTSWHKTTIDLSAYNSSITKLRIKGVTGSDFKSDMAVDLIKISAALPQWNVVQTADNHTVIVWDTLNTNINGTPIQRGDYIGFFYDDNGTDQCAGFGVWDSTILSIAVWGNDTIVGAKNGFDDGERFKTKIYQVATGAQIEVDAVYNIPDGVNITDTDSFMVDGISAINGFFADTLSTLTIPLTQGWNMISSNIDLVNLLLDSVYSDIITQVIIVKDNDGNTFLPSFNMNNIGNWNVLKGYQIKVTQDTSLTLIGQLIDPLVTPILLQQGWQMIAYLHDTPLDASNVFNTIDNDIVIVKNGIGETYIPAYAINDIGNMSAGQGYKVKAIVNTTLNYPQNTFGKTTITPFTPGLDNVHFIRSTINSGQNATIIFPTFAMNTFAIGDEIGVFNSIGTLCGSGVYNGNNFAITVWGDNNETPIQDGMLSNEAYIFKVWKQISNVELPVMMTFSQGTGDYSTDAITIVATINTTTGTNNFKSDFINKVISFPNPAQNNITFRIDLATAQNITLYITDAQGKQHAIIDDRYLSTGITDIPVDLTPFASGIYFYHIVSDNNRFTQRFTVVK